CTVGDLVTVFDDVRAFAQLSHPESVASEPVIPSVAVTRFCRNLLDSELRELTKARMHRDLPEIADALADCIYVLIFTALCYGSPIEEVWAEVARTNMAKVAGTSIRRRADGKIMKPDGWEPPDIAAIIERARKRSA